MYNVSKKNNKTITYNQESPKLLAKSLLALWNRQYVTSSGYYRLKIKYDELTSFSIKYVAKQKIISVIRRLDHKEACQKSDVPVKVMK